MSGRASRPFLDCTGGLLEGAPGKIVPTPFLPAARNIEILTDGTLQIPRRATVENWTTDALAGPIVGLWRFERQDGSVAHIAIAGTTVYRIAATGRPWAIGAVTEIDEGAWTAAVYMNRLFMFGPDNEPLVYGGGAAGTDLDLISDLDGIDLPLSWEPGNWPTGVTLIGADKTERLAAWGCSQRPSDVHLCGNRDFLDWDWTETSSTAFRLRVLEGDGEPVIGVSDFQQLLLCHKQTKTVVYADVDPVAGTASGMRVIPFGLVGPLAIKRVENDVHWFSPQGPVPLSAWDAYGDVFVNVATDRIRDFLTELDANRLHQIVAIHDRQNERIRYLVPLQNEPHNSGVIDYHLLRRHADPQGVTLGAFLVGDLLEGCYASSLNTAGQWIVLLGDYEGNVRHMDFGVLDSYGDFWESYFELPHMDLGVRGQVLLADFLMAEGGENLTASIRFDDQNWRPLPGTLAPSFGHQRTPAISRKVPTGLGGRLGLRVDYAGGGIVSRFQRVQLDLRGVDTP